MISDFKDLLKDDGTHLGPKGILELNTTGVDNGKNPPDVETVRSLTTAKFFLTKLWIKVLFSCPGCSSCAMDGACVCACSVRSAPVDRPRAPLLCYYNLENIIIWLYAAQCMIPQ